jgi:Holliday junction resolvase RusA-like endonuclease
VRLHIAAVGRPAPQGSKEQGGAGQLLESSAYLPAWRTAVRAAAYEAYRQRGIDPATLPVFPAGVPVYVELCTFFVGPEQCRAAGTDAPTGTPDIDKLLRAVLDALGGQQRGSARLFADDSQVVSIDCLRKERGNGLNGWALQTGMYMIISDGSD